MFYLEQWHDYLGLAGHVQSESRMVVKGEEAPDFRFEVGGKDNSDYVWPNLALSLKKYAQGGKPYFGGKDEKHKS